VTDTKRFRDPKTTPQGTNELQIRVACKGRSTTTVLVDLSCALAEAEARQADPLIVLEDLGLLQDSVTSLMKGLSRLLANYPRTVTFWEASGLTEAFLSVMERQPPAQP
jgi:hypothetical protein